MLRKQLQRIEDDKKRSNVKSKRSRNLVKKCDQLAQLCGLKITLVIFDANLNQLQEYNSSLDFTTFEISDMIRNDQLSKSKPTFVKKGKTFIKH